MSNRILTYMEILKDDTQEYVTGIPESGDLIWINKRINSGKGLFNKYGTIGGKIESGKSQKEALIREAKEEAGTTIQEFQYLNTKEYMEPEEHFPKRRIVHTYIIKISGTPLNKEPHNIDNWYQEDWRRLKDLPIIGSLSEYYNFRKKEDEIYTKQDVEDFWGYPYLEFCAFGQRYGETIEASARDKVATRKVKVVRDLKRALLFIK